MNEHELFQKSFSGLHAADDTLQKMMNRAHRDQGKNIRPRRIAVLVAATVALFSTALLLHGSLFVDLADVPAVLSPAQNPGQVIDEAYSNNISTQKPNMYDTQGNPIHLPDMERPAADLTKNNQLIGAYISDVDAVVTVGDNTFTLKNFLIDETGAGALTWTVENPNGIDYGNAGYGFVYFATLSPFDQPMLYHYGEEGQKKTFACEFTALTSKNEAGTKLELVSYFGTFDKYEIGDHFVFSVSRNGGKDQKTIQITPTAHIPVKTLTSPDGMQLFIANHSLTLDVNADSNLISFKKIVIHFKDGSRYCLIDWDGYIDNCSGALQKSTDTYCDDDEVYLFNRLIDTGEVASVTLEADYYQTTFEGDHEETVSHRKTLSFYP